MKNLLQKNKLHDFPCMHAFWPFFFMHAKVSFPILVSPPFFSLPPPLQVRSYTLNLSIMPIFFFILLCNIKIKKKTKVSEKKKPPARLPPQPPFLSNLLILYPSSSYSGHHPRSHHRHLNSQCSAAASEHYAQSKHYYSFHVHPVDYHHRWRSHSTPSPYP